MTRTMAIRLRNRFIATILTQVLVTSFFILPWIIMYIYHTVIPNSNENFQQFSTEIFLFLLTNDLYYIIHVKSFYVSALTSRLFRETIIKSLVTLFNKFCGKLLEIRPLIFSILPNRWSKWMNLAWSFNIFQLDL